MVERDVGDDGEQGRDDVGAVKPTAQSHLDDGDVNLLFGEILEGQGRGQLEK